MKATDFASSGQGRLTKIEIDGKLFLLANMI